MLKKSIHILSLLLFFSILYKLDLKAQYNLDSVYNYTFLEQALDSAKQHRNYKDLADIYFLMGNYEDQVNVNYRKAFNNYTWSLTYYKMTNDSSQIDHIKYNIAIKYHQANMNDEAITLLIETKNTFLKKEKYHQAIQALLELSKIYHEKSELDQELSILKEAKSINKKHYDDDLQIKILLQEIEVFIQYQDYTAALKKAFYSFELSNKSNKKHLKGVTVSKIGKINKLQKNYKNTTKYILSSLSLMDYMPYDNYRLSCYEDLAYSFRELNDYENAYEYQKKYALLSDSINHFDRLKAINNIAIKYESKEKKHAIKTLEKENIEVQDQVEIQQNWVYTLVAGLIVLILIGYYLIRHYSHRIKTNKIITIQKEKINDQKIRELEDKIVLSSMQSLMDGQEKERHRVAQDLHDSLGGLLSTIKLQYNHFINKQVNQPQKEAGKVNDLLDLAVNEIRSISHDLQPESLNKLGLIPAIHDLITRVNSENSPNIDFQYYNIPKDMDHKTSLNIYRILQELLNNAIKHSKAKEILIQLNQEEDGDILVQFEDDGVGYDLENIKSKGMGLDNINSRIAYLKGEVEVDTSIGEGTSVLIRIKQKI